MKILIADDHELISELIKTVVEVQNLGASVATCGSFDEAFALAGTRKVGQDRNFDLIVLDMRMPGMNGVSGLRRMLGIAQGAPVAIISGAVSPAEAREIMREGAAGFLPKTMGVTELADALKKLLAGERYLPDFLMAGKNSEAVAARAPQVETIANLTAREQEVLEEVMQGWSNKQIADHLSVAEITVKTHLTALFRKLGAKNRTDAARIALQMKANRPGAAAENPAG
jgi:two-component system, NarL family, nitrate/nitrite response regulator NarL